MRLRSDWSIIRVAVLGLGSALFVYLTVVMTLAYGGGIISNDLSGYLAPVVAMVHGTGAPYVDYFDIKPPGLTFLLVPWVAVFGYALPSLIVLDALLLVGNLVLFHYLLRLVTSPLLADGIYVITIVAAFGLQIFGMFLMSETVGSFFFLLAIALAIRFREYPQVFLWVGGLCAFCSQVKEVWFFGVFPLAVFGFLVTKKLRTLVWLGLGWLGMIGLLGLGLVAYGALGAYFDVLRYKSEAFPLPVSLGGAKELLRTIFYGSFNLWLLWWPVFPLEIGLGFLARRRILGWVGAVRELVSYKQLVALLLLLVWGAVVVGFAWQAKRISGHNYAMLLFPVMLLTAVGLSYVAESLGPALREALRGRRLMAATAALLIASLIPSIGVVKGLDNDWRYLGRTDQVTTLTTLESPALLSEFQYISAHLGGSRCVQVAYGWRAGATYIYTHTNPCSRFIFSNLLTDPTVDRQFRADMVARPPDVIVYATDTGDLDNLNVPQFEKTVFPYTAVLSACYTPSDVTSVYLALNGVRAQSQCIADQLREGGWEL